MTEQKLAKAEVAIEMLDDALGVNESYIVSLLRAGMEEKAQITNELKRADDFFLSEMEATFGCH